MPDRYIDKAETSMNYQNNTHTVRVQRGLAWAAIALARALVGWLDRH